MPSYMKFSMVLILYLEPINSTDLLEFIFLSIVMVKHYYYLQDIMSNVYDG